MKLYPCKSENPMTPTLEENKGNQTQGKQWDSKNTLAAFESGIRVIQ